MITYMYGVIKKNNHLKYLLDNLINVLVLMNMLSLKV